ncbi:hypothetical protein N7495_003591 [Penicillium taxi]|uniref:uncharacterized protein n=1 Tax=Penicillium taxi TaxID=168475 RepID=UPI0025455653|nr:uncharacterized protein N7495_003591 [Penicillium taxi]KAJ5898847.1 hypothetical protein N7495_003591 [Penicillium taxi]
MWEACHLYQLDALTIDTNPPGIDNDLDNLNLSWAHRMNQDKNLKLEDKPRRLLASPKILRQEAAEMVV